MNTDGERLSAAELSSERTNITWRAFDLSSACERRSGVCCSASGYSSEAAEEGSPEDAFMQRCQQQIASLVALADSSCDGAEPQLPMTMLARIGSPWNSRVISK